MFFLKKIVTYNREMKDYFSVSIGLGLDWDQGLRKT